MRLNFLYVSLIWADFSDVSILFVNDVPVAGLVYFRAISQMGEYRTLSMREINGYLKSPDTIVDEAFLAHCIRHSGYLIPQFADLSTSNDLGIRFNAVWLLMHLEYREGVGRALSFIYDTTQYIRRAPIEDKGSRERIELLRKKAIVALNELPVSFSTDQESFLLDTLLSILETDKDPEIFDKCISLISSFEHPDARSRLESAFDQSSGLQMCYMAITLAIWFQNPKANEIIHYLLTSRDQPFAFNDRDNSDDSWRLLFVYLDVTAPDKLDSNLVSVVRSYISNNFNSSGSKVNSRIARCLESLPVTRFSGHADFINQILNSRLDKKVKTIAIKKLAEINKRESVDTVFTLLDQNSKDMDAANVLLQLTLFLRQSDQKEDKFLIGEIREKLTSFVEQDPYILTGMYGEIYPYWETLLSVCRSDHVLVEKYGGLQDPLEQMKLHCVVKAVKAEDVLGFMQSKNIIGELRNETAQQFIKSWNVDKEHFPALLSLFKEYRMSGSVRHTCSNIPPDYREFLGNIEAITSPEFVVTELIQQWNDKPKLHEIAVKFLSGKQDVPGPDYYNLNIKYEHRSNDYKVKGNGYKFSVQEFVGIINDVLAQSGMRERLFLLYGRGDFSSVVFAPAPEFFEMTKMFRLPVLADEENIDMLKEPPVRQPLIWQGYSSDYLRITSHR